MPSLIGNKPNQVPSNGDLGTLAFQDSNAVNITGGVVDVSAGTAALPTLGTTGDPNTGVFFPAADTVAVATNGAERVRVDANGSVGVGVTPSAWSSYKGFDINTYGSISADTATTVMSGNSYYNGTNWIYKLTARSSDYYQANGSHVWRYATSGTAGNAITFTQAMTLDANGNLGVGTTPSAWGSNFKVIESTGGSSAVYAANNINGLRLTSNLYNDNTNFIYKTTGGAAFYSINTSIHQWFNAPSGTAGTTATAVQRMVLDASGNLGLGVTPSAWNTATKNIQNPAGTIYSINTTDIGVAQNLFLDSTGTWKYVNTAAASYFAQTGGAFSWATVASGTTGTTAGLTSKMTLDNSGNLLVGVSSVNANGGVLQLKSGITFPATQVASTDANTLDDYEEGTFTPTIIGTTTDGTGTYSANSQIGRYTRIGNRVYFNIYLVWTAHTGTGNMRISGLPFTSIATTNTFNAVSTWNANIALTASNLLTAYVNVNATTVELRQYSTGGGADAAIPIDTAGSIMVAGHYEV